MPTIGLFGTCGNSKWREPFIAEYRKKKIQFYNPQVDNWTEDCAEIEARHMASDEIILFPVTSETLGTVHLQGTNESILNVIRMNDDRDIVVMIDKEYKGELPHGPLKRTEDSRLRIFTSAYLKNVKFKNVYVVESLQQMLDISLVLYEIAVQRASIKKFSLSG